MNEELAELQTVLDGIVLYFTSKAPQLIAAFVILVIGLLMSRVIGRFIERFCTKKKIDVTLTRFFTSSFRTIIIVLFAIVAVNKIGIEITPLIALLGAGAFGLSLAVQGPVSNYGAGVVLIITRPFKVDDTLTVEGNTGIVTLVSLGFTQLMTEDGQEITIPNRHILGEVLTNSFKLMVVEGVVGIDYSSDPEQAIAAVEGAVNNVENVSSERTPQVGIQGFGDSSIDIAYRYWVPTSNYYCIQYAVNLAVFKALAKANITIPFPQRDVHLVKEETA